MTWYAPPSKKVRINVRLDEVVLRTLEVEPEKRYQHASEVKTRIEEINDQENTPSAKPCPHCAGTELYTRRVSSAASNLLPGLGRFLHHAEFDVVVCACCGLTRFFAEPAARQNARSNEAWKRL